MKEEKKGTPNSQDQPQGPRFLNAQQVADRYGLTVKWVYGCRTLPRRKVGKYLVFREDELEQFEKSWQQATPSHRVYMTKLQQGITGNEAESHNTSERYTRMDEQKPREFVLMFDME